jgi:sentrin-specific protease 1
MEFCYEGVTSWTKTLDIFALDKIIFPINIDNGHWTLACVYMQRKEIHYFDSMSGKGNIYTNALLQWVEQESIKKNEYFDKSQWELIDCKDNPKQNSRSVDCGAFVIACADFLIDDLPINTDSYSQENMPQWRMKIATDILRKQLRY